MNRQQRRATAKNAPKTQFILTAAINPKNNDIRIQVTNAPLMDMFDIMGDAGVCESMVSKYLDRDDDLTPVETMHFANWCCGFKHAVDAGKLTSHIQAMNVAFRTLSDATAAVEVLKNVLRKCNFLLNPKRLDPALGAFLSLEFFLVLGQPRWV